MCVCVCVCHHVCEFVYSLMCESHFSQSPTHSVGHTLATSLSVSLTLLTNSSLSGCLCLCLSLCLSYLHTDDVRRELLYLEQYSVSAGCQVEKFGFAVLELIHTGPAAVKRNKNTDQGRHGPYLARTHAHKHWHHSHRGTAILTICPLKKPVRSSDALTCVCQNETGSELNFGSGLALIPPQ